MSGILTTNKKVSFDADLATLEQVAELIRKGDLKSLPEEVLINFSKIDRKDFQTLLEIVRYKSFGHKVIVNEDIKDQLLLTPAAADLSKIRGLIHTGRYQEALAFIQTQVESANDPEILLEKALALSMTSRFNEAAKILSPLVHGDQLAPNSRGVALQILGHSNLETGNLDKSIIYLRAALERAESLGNKSGEFSALSFMVKYFLFSGNLSEAKITLEHKEQVVRSTPTFRWMLGFYRALAHFQFFSGDPKALDTVQLTYLLSKNLGDQVFETRALLERDFMSKKFLGLKMANEDTIASVALYSHLCPDLNNWLEILNDPTQAPHTESIRQFNKQAMEPVSIEEHFGKILSASNALQMRPPKWIYDTQRSLLIDLFKSEITTLPDDSNLAKILTVLSAPRTEALSHSELFEKVWGLKWSEDRHMSLLKVSLGRVNRLTPSIKVVTKNKAIRLEEAGVIL